MCDVASSAMFSFDDATDADRESTNSTDCTKSNMDVQAVAPAWSLRRSNDGDQKRDGL